ncbi:MAG: Ppx/GppA phosphatase family protein [Bacteroidota bacterium]
MRIAVIDLGTNTFNLLIADIISSAEYKSVFKTKIPVKLGEGGIARNRIAPAAFGRGIEALVRYKKLLGDFRAEQVFAFATSAIRSASNGKQFVRAAREATGIQVQVISGDREAELIYKGVKQALDIGPEPSLVLDIGGGSNEFIIATSGTMLHRQSFDLGVARMLEKFRPSDPISEKDVRALESYFTGELEPLFEAAARHPVKELIGASGSFDTFAGMIAHRFHTPEILKGRTEYEFSLDEFRAVHEQLLRSTAAERLQTKGIIPMRVDMIVIASVFVNLILEKLALRRMRLSTYSLKEGVLHELMGTV